MFYNIRRIVKQRHILKNLILRNFKMKYVGSSLGVFWVFVNPLLLMSVITFVFSVIFKIDIADFHLFILAAIFPWLVFSISVSESAYSIINQAGILKQFNIACEMLPIASVAANFLNFLLGWSLVILLFLFINPNIFCFIPLVFLLVLMQFFFTVGIALVIGTLNVFRRDIGKLLEVSLMLMMWMTPVFYTIDMVPVHFRWLIYVNPMTPFIVGYRSCLFYVSIPQLGVLAGVACWTLICFFIGLLVFNRFEKRLVKRV